MYSCILLFVNAFSIDFFNPDKLASMVVDNSFSLVDKSWALCFKVSPAKAKLVVSTKALETKKERDTYDKYVAQQAKETPKSTIGDILEEQAAEKAAKTKGRK